MAWMARGQREAQEAVAATSTLHLAEPVLGKKKSRLSSYLQISTSPHTFLVPPSEIFSLPVVASVPGDLIN